MLPIVEAQILQNIYQSHLIVTVSLIRVVDITLFEDHTNGANILISCYTHTKKKYLCSSESIGNFKNLSLIQNF